MPSPVRRAFDYLLPEEPADSVPGKVLPGMRVKVPFGRGTRIGVVVGRSQQSGVETSRLKRIHAVLDDEPLLEADTVELLRWAADYFHHPLGDVVLGALPPALRRGGIPAPTAPSTIWRISPSGAGVDPRRLHGATRQARVLERLQANPDGLCAADIALDGGAWRAALGRLCERGFVDTVLRPEAPLPSAAPSVGIELNPAQRAVVDAVINAPGGFGVFLLDGVTGSGKTEVYLELIERTLAAGRQALVLIPEIGLTPQIVARFEARTSRPLVVLHSGLTDRQRLDAWLAARDGRAGVVVGTRSAVFSPIANPGLVVVDEEHDPSYKQQDGFRYSARDLAVKRAQRWQVPVILGTATPSLESIHNAARNRYIDLSLPHRAGGASAPPIDVVDLRGQGFEDGLSRPMLIAIEERLARREQALLFINRRGYAPVLLCHHCGWIADCTRCDAHLVFHQRMARLRCHHCGHEAVPPRKCPTCEGVDFRPIGLGTERVAEALRDRFPQARVARMDRDSTRHKGSLEALLDAIGRREVDILVGTQMLAKGHHFPNVTLVGILDADGGLFSADFRAPERMAQLLVQVAGRSGRGDRPGQVLVQTHQPHHPLLQQLIHNGYRAFALQALDERRAAHLPPFTSLALLRAEASGPVPVERFLTDAIASAEPDRQPPIQHSLRPSVRQPVRLFGPVPALMERRAGKHRAHVLVESDSRRTLQAMLRDWVATLGTLESASRVRWSLDVDPQEIL